ncbi:MAG: hypothetical protein P8Y52_11775, partial [Xanthomonadales bacterium]
NLLPGDGALTTADCWDYTVSEEGAESYDDANENGKWDPAEPFIDIDGDGEFDADSPRPEPWTDLDDSGDWTDAEDFDDRNGNGVADEFVFNCADPEPLSDKDFVSGSTNLAAAASKHGFATQDLLQYMNRILKITKNTQITKSTVHTLPALYRDCWAADVPPLDPLETDEEWFDPEYLPVEDCLIEDADAAPPGSELFPDLQERFVDYGRFEEYKRDDFDDVTIVTKDHVLGAWTLAEDESLLGWVELVNGIDFNESYIEGAVDAINDVIRSIEFVHNYDPPEDLYCVYQLEGCYAE